MIISHKTECYPNGSQKELFEKCFGMRRFYFNKTIMTLKQKFGDLKESRKLITKKEVFCFKRSVFRDHYYDLVRSVPSHILNTAMDDVMFALDSLWKKGQIITLRKKKLSNTFRINKSGIRGSFVYTNGEKQLRLPTIGYVKLAEPLRWDDADIKTVTIKKVAGRYFISITCEIPDKPRYTPKNIHIGIDWGVKTYITGFDGHQILKGDFDTVKLERLDKNVSRKQKALSRKVRNSKNWQKAKIKLEQAYLNFVNYRLDCIRKWVHELDQNYDSVTFEDLGMRFVTSNRRLARAAARKPYYLLKNCTVNKFSQTGKTVFLTPKSYPSTQTCYVCGSCKTGKEKMVLGDAVYICHECGNEDDRDENAAKNIWGFKELEVATLDS